MPDEVLAAPARRVPRRERIALRGKPLDDPLVPLVQVDVSLGSSTAFHDLGCMITAVASAFLRLECADRIRERVEVRDRRAVRSHRDRLRPDDVLEPANLRRGGRAFIEAEVKLERERPEQVRPPSVTSPVS